MTTQLSNPNEPDAAAAVNEMTARLKDRMAKARDRVGDAMSAAKDRSYEIRDRAADRIQGAPFRSIGLAVGAGLIIGWLLARGD